jgi:hypothetical protein
MGGVFDLRQQLDFMPTQWANRRGELNKLGRHREGKP